MMPDPRLYLRRLAFALDAIDAIATRGRSPGWRMLAPVLIVTVVCLLGIHYLKFTSALYGFVDTVFGRNTHQFLFAGTWGALLEQAWWGVVHLLGYVLVPVALLRWGLRVRVVDYGLRWGDTTRWLGWYAALAAPIVAFAFVASFSDAFADTYPFYEEAGRSWADLVLWEVIYLGQFVCLEFFFRGFLLESLVQRLGASAVFVMVVPYTMIHFPKPWPEAVGAVLFGICLGILALRSGSIWGGVLVHGTIALTMDLCSLAQTGRWPTQLWPG